MGMNSVTLIIDSSDEHYGQIGQLRYHRQEGKGMLYHVTFENSWEDYTTLNGELSPIRTFYRKDDPHGKYLDEEGDLGPSGFIKAYLDLRKGNIDDLARDYKKLFKEELPIPKNPRSKR